MTTWRRKFAKHGRDALCPACLKNYKKLGYQTNGWDMPPLVNFARGWFSVGATHWFEADDASSVFVSKDGKRTLAAAICGGICEVTMTWAPRAGNECGKCLVALRKLGADV